MFLGPRLKWFSTHESQVTTVTGARVQDLVQPVFIRQFCLWNKGGNPTVFRFPFRVSTPQKVALFKVDLEQRLLPLVFHFISHGRKKRRGLVNSFTCQGSKGQTFGRKDALFK